MTAATEDNLPVLGVTDLRRPPEPSAGFARVDDGTGLFKLKGEPKLDIGSDGDDDGCSGRDQAIGDMLDSGHGFLVRGVDQPKTVRRETCEVCGVPLPTPGNDPDWLCQYYDETRLASQTCNCSWCLNYQEYLAGKYHPQGGRPRKRCGSKECERKADAERKRLDRAAKRAGVEPPPPPLAEVVRQPGPSASFSLDTIAVAGRGRLSIRPADWNRRNPQEPNWWLSGQLKRGLWSPVRKTP